MTKTTLVRREQIKKISERRPMNRRKKAKDALNPTVWRPAASDDPGGA